MVRLECDHGVTTVPSGKVTQRSYFPTKVNLELVLFLVAILLQTSLLFHRNSPCHCVAVMSQSVLNGLL